MLRRILFIGVAAAVVWGGAQADDGVATERATSVAKKSDRSGMNVCIRQEGEKTNCDYVVFDHPQRKR